MRARDALLQAFLFLSAGAFIASLFFFWWKSAEFPRVAESTITGDLCSAVVVAIIVCSLYALKYDDHRLALGRFYLAIALVALTVLALAELSHSYYDPYGRGRYGGRPGPGGIVALCSSLAILWAVLAIDFGGLRRLFRRDRGASS